MNTKQDNTSKSTADREIVTTRIFDAPRELVFAAFTDPKHVSSWWGPKGFSTTTQEMDLKPGGVWIFIMHGPDGTDYHNKIVYREVVKPERLVYSHGGTGDHEHIQFENTVTFEDQGGKTKLTMRAVFKTAAERDFVVKEHGAIEGGKQTLERLAGHIDSIATGGIDQEIVSTRLFSAPRELVFKAWSDPAQQVQWWGPKGFTNTIHEFDLRPGGTWRLTMHGPNGTNYENEKKFIEVVKPERVVFQHLGPMHRFKMTMLFAEEAGKTRLTWRMLFESADESTKLRNFISAANEENFDRLEAHLARMA